MTFALPKKTRILWQIRLFLVFVILYVAFVYFCHICPTILPTIIAFAIWSVFVFVYTSIYFKNYKIIIEKSSICIKKGVICSSFVIIPCARLAFTKTFCSPVMALLNLRCIVLKVARGWIFIPEVEKEDVESIIKLVQNE